MNKYVLIETKTPILEHEDVMVSVIEHYVHIDQIKTETNRLIIHFKGAIDTSFEDIALNMMTDIMTDLRVYESYYFENNEQMKKHIDFMIRTMDQIPFVKYPYLNDHLVLHHLIRHVSQEHRGFILKRFAQDESMLETIQTYLESDQNTVLASKRLFLHRNTLLQRLEKFDMVTGFDVRKFIDAYLIYSLL